MRGVGHGSVLREFRTLFHLGVVGSLTDAQLLERFLEHQNGPTAEAAFSALVDRHGPMVFAACRHLLGGDAHAAEDAFQAVFLILARKARSIRVNDSLAPWLHGVAHRVAARAGRDRRRRRDRDGLDAAAGVPSGDDGPESIAGRRETRALIHEELRRLPARYRAPIVLCYLEARTHEEAARQLGWPVGTVRGRLSRARDLLRRRLARRGVALPAAGFAATLARDASATLVPPLLVNQTVQAALAATSAAGGTAALAGLVSTTALSLADGAMRSMLLVKLKFAAAGVLALGATVSGTGMYVQSVGADDSAGDGPAVRSATPNSPQTLREPTVEDEEIPRDRELLHRLTHDAARAFLEDAAARQRRLDNLRKRLEAEEQAVEREKDPVLLDALRLQIQWLENKEAESGWLWEQELDRIRKQVQDLRADAGEEQDRHAVERIEEIEAKLYKIDTVEFQDKPLLRPWMTSPATHGLSIVLNPNALAEQGLTPKVPVTLNAKDISLKSALKVMLQPLELTYKIEPGVVCITGLPVADRLLNAYRRRDRLKQQRSRAARAIESSNPDADAGNDPAMDALRIADDMGNVLFRYQGLVNALTESRDNALARLAEPLDEDRREAHDRQMRLLSQHNEEMARLTRDLLDIALRDAEQSKALRILRPGSGSVGDRTATSTINFLSNPSRQTARADPTSLTPSGHGWSRWSGALQEMSPPEPAQPD